LFGELGAGKSTFARAMIQQLSGEEEVPSPTFTLLQQYHTPIGVLSHYDLYRVKHVNELAELAIDDALQQGVCLIEWPEVALPLLPSDCLEIRIASTKDEKTRHFEVKGSPRWQRRWLYKTTT
jgi:tRNA threonylcarbamoyl adenosine modification protein YjeE